MADQSIQGINAIAIARGTSEPSNTDVLWLDENLEGGLYSRLKAYVSGEWKLISRVPQEILTDLKTVDGAGSGLDADTLRGYTPDDFLGSGSEPLSVGQLLVGQTNNEGASKTISGIATINASGSLSYVANSISHTGLTDVGTNTHAQIDTHIANTANPHGVTAAQVGNSVSQWNANSIEGNLTNIGTLGASADGKAVVWDNATSRFIMSSAGLSDGDYGDITVGGSGTSMTIDNGVVSNAKLADVATSTFKGRATAGSGDPEDLTATQARTILNVEDGADVTDTTNVTAAGALMDSEITNLAQVKSFDSADYATAAQGALADSAQQPPSEGAFVNGDKTKLDGIEAGATTDQTDAEIETAYNNQVAAATQAEAEAGTSTDIKRWTPQRVKQAIDALASGSSIYSDNGTVGSGRVATITDTLEFAGGQIALSSTNDGILLNRLTTAQKNAISSPGTNEVLIDTDLKSLQRYDGSNWVSLAGYGILSITNSQGEPTFYTTLTLAIAGASAGDTIEQYGDITDSSGATIVVNIGLTINMNGYTYTNSSTGSSDSISITTTDKVKVLNGTIKRENGTYGSAANRGAVCGVGSDVDFTGTTVINAGGISVYSTSDTTNIFNGRFISTGLTGSQFSVLATCNFIGSIFESSGINKFTGTLFNIKASTTLGYNHLKGSDSEARNSEFKVTNASGSHGLLIEDSKAYHCDCYTIGSGAIGGLTIGGLDTAEAWYCLGHSANTNGILTGTGTPKGLYYCTGYNVSGGYGGKLINLEEVKHCTFISESGSGGAWSSGTDILFDNCNFKSGSVSSYTYGFYDSLGSGTVRVYNCLVETGGSSASMIFTSGKTVYLANNRIKGGSGVSNSNGNSQATTSDAYGNIILD